MIYNADGEILRPIIVHGGKCLRILPSKITGICLLLSRVKMDKLTERLFGLSGMQ